MTLLPFLVIGLALYWNVNRKILRPVKVQNAVRQLSGQLNDEGVRQFIVFISKSRIPNEPRAWNACRAAYELVRSSNTVSESAKVNLKNALLSGGVSGIR